MRRRLFTLASAGSLVLCVAILALWACSRFTAGNRLELLHRLVHHRVDDQGRPYLTQVTIRGFAFREGCLIVYHCPMLRRYNPSRRSGWEFKRTSAGRNLRQPGQMFWAVSENDEIDHIAPRYDEIGVRAILVVALTAILPTWRAIAALHNRVRAHGGRCAQCAYDLRATPHRCPECGAVPSDPLSTMGRA